MYLIRAAADRILGIGDRASLRPASSCILDKTATLLAASALKVAISIKHQARTVYAFSLMMVSLAPPCLGSQSLE